MINNSRANENNFFFSKKLHLNKQIDSLIFEISFWEEKKLHRILTETLFLARFKVLAVHQTRRIDNEPRSGSSASRGPPRIPYDYVL